MSHHSILLRVHAFRIKSNKSSLQPFVTRKTVVNIIYRLRVKKRFITLFKQCV